MDYSPSAVTVQGKAQLQKGIEKERERERERGGRKRATMSVKRVEESCTSSARKVNFSLH